MSVLSKLSFAVSASSLLYNVVLTLFRYSTFEIKHIGESVLELFVFGGLFGISAVLNNILVSDVKEIVFSLVVLADILLVRRIYTKHVVGNAFNKVDLSGKVFIITGSNAGIGGNSHF